LFLANLYPLSYCDGDIAVAKAKGYVMGEVSSVELDILERQTTSRGYFWNKFMPSEDRDSEQIIPSRDRAILAFLVSANPFRKADLVCVLKHNPTPVIVRHAMTFLKLSNLMLFLMMQVWREIGTQIGYSSTENDYEKWVEALNRSHSSRWISYSLAMECDISQQEYKEVEAKCGIQKVSSSKAERLSKVALVMAGSSASN